MLYDRRVDFLGFTCRQLLIIKSDQKQIQDQYTGEPILSYPASLSFYFLFVLFQFRNISNLTPDDEVHPQER